MGSDTWIDGLPREIDAKRAAEDFARYLNLPDVVITAHGGFWSVTLPGAPHDWRGMLPREVFNERRWAEFWRTSDTPLQITTRSQDALVCDVVAGFARRLAQMHKGTVEE